jgi:tetratricopeptide (TPR) repeat protein
MTNGPMRIVAAAAACLVVVSGVAHGAETEVDRKRRAKAFVEEANSKYDLGKYDEAIGLYEQAYQIWPYPETLFNLCQAYRQKKDLEKAVFYCKSYLRNDPGTEKRETVEARIEEMEAALGAAKATIEKPPKDVEPAGTPSRAAPAAVAPAPAVDRPHVAAWYRDPVGWILVGGGVALLGTSGALFASASGLRDDGDASLTPDGQADAYERADARTLFADVTLGAGAAALAAGVVKLWLHDEAPLTPGVAFEPQRGGFRLVWTGTF